MRIVHRMKPPPPTLAQLLALATDRRECGDTAGHHVALLALEHTPRGRARSACTWCGVPAGRRVALPSTTDGQPSRCRDCAADPDVPSIGPADQALAAAAALLARCPLIGIRWYESAREHGATAAEWRAIGAELAANAHGLTAVSYADRARDCEDRAAQLERAVVS